MRFPAFGTRLGVTALLGVLAGSCNTSAPTLPPLGLWEGDFSFQFDDAVGDTLPPSAGTTAAGLDLLSVDGTMADQTITFRLTFNSPVTPFTGGGPTALNGFIDIDVDENGATGIQAAADTLAGVTTGLGVDVFISLRDVVIGQTIGRVVDTQSGVVSNTGMQFTGSQVIVSLNRPNQMRNDDGNVKVSVVVGQGDRGVTDIGPNTASFVIRRPTS